MRSTIINFFRIPLNLFVCVVLYNVRGAGAVCCGGGVSCVMLQGPPCLLAHCPPTLPTHPALPPSRTHR